MLKVNGIDVYYGKVQALFDVSIEVGDNEIVSIIGANGAGKTTLKTLQNQGLLTIIAIVKGNPLYVRPV